MALVRGCFKIHKCPWGHLHKHCDHPQKWWASPFSWWKPEDSSKSKYFLYRKYQRINFLKRSPQHFLWPISLPVSSPSSVPTPLLHSSRWPFPIPCCPPSPACRETPAVPCCTHRQASQNSGKSHLLEVYERDILKNFKPEPMHHSSYHNYYIYYISWQVHLKLQGAKAQFVSIACSKLSLPAAVRKNSIGTNTVFSFPNTLWSLTSSRFQKGFAWHHLQRERSLLPLATQQKSTGDERTHLLLATNGAFFLKQALYVLIYSVRRQTGLKQNPVS